ncbi:hypothetical protein TM102_44290 [Bradyrhizobium sp. TM102]|nr:hypothetical protein TM102_44290 [Bradyrhizobium sp. TM102]
MLDGAEAAQILEIVDVDVPVVDLVAARAQEVADHVLARPLRPAGRRDCDKIACGGELGLEAGIDGVKNPLLRFGIHQATPGIPMVPKERAS